MEEEKKELDWCEMTTQKVEEQIKNINEEGIQPSNIQYLSELIDIHKDLANEIYWKEKIDIMYNEGGNYGNYIMVMETMVNTMKVLTENTMKVETMVVEV